MLFRFEVPLTRDAAVGFSFRQPNVAALLEKRAAAFFFQITNLGHHWTPSSVQDAWIAATALRHSCPLLTHNGADFEDIANQTVITVAHILPIFAQAY